MYLLLPHSGKRFDLDQGASFFRKIDFFQLKNGLFIVKIFKLIFYLLSRFSILSGYHKNMDFPGTMRSVNHSGFDIGGFTGTGYKGHAIG